MKKIALGLAISYISAFALQVNPIPIEIMQDKKLREFSISDDTGKYQVFIQEWKQAQNGEDILTDTTDLVAYPNILQAPKKIKVYKKKSHIVQEELSYRLILKELNIENGSQVGSTKVLKILSIPIFLVPSTPDPQLEYTCNDDTLQIKNSGNMHYKILSVADKKMNEYILPNTIKEVRNVKDSGTIETNRQSYEYKCVNTK